MHRICDVMVGVADCEYSHIGVRRDTDPSRTGTGGWFVPSWWQGTNRGLRVGVGGRGVQGAVGMEV